MPRGAAPGERRGGRTKGTPNKRTIGRRAALIRAANEAADAANGKLLDWNALAEMRKIAMVLIGMAGREQRKPPDKRDNRWLLEVLEAASRVLSHIMPYEHRRLASLPATVETVVSKGGVVRVTVSQTDAAL